MTLTTGQRLGSTVCECEIIVVRAPVADEVQVECGGVPMSARGESQQHADGRPDLMSGTALGQRYEDPASGLEVLCTKSGAGSLSVSGTVLRRKIAKPLPSSD